MVGMIGMMCMIRLQNSRHRGILHRQAKEANAKSWLEKDAVASVLAC